MRNIAHTSCMPATSSAHQFSHSISCAAFFDIRLNIFIICYVCGGDFMLANASLRWLNDDFFMFFSSLSSVTLMLCSWNKSVIFTPPQSFEKISSKHWPICAKCVLPDSIESSDESSNIIKLRLRVKTWKKKQQHPYFGRIKAKNWFRTQKQSITCRIVAQRSRSEIEVYHNVNV